MYALRATGSRKTTALPGVTQQSIRGGSAPKSTPWPFYPDTCTIFDRKGSSFVYAPLKNGTS